MNINFKDYFWGKCDDLHERYHLKRITMSNIIDFFTYIKNYMSIFANQINDLITKDIILYPENKTTKYEAMEFIKLLLTIQSTQLNVGIEIIKTRILDTIKVEKEEEIKEKELYTELNKLINKYEESKSSVIKAKEKFYQSCKIAEKSIQEAKIFELKEKDKENYNTINEISSNNNNKNIININENNETLVKLEQKYLEDLIEARNNDEKYIEGLKETNN